MRLPKIDSATARGLRTAVQTLAGFMAALLVMPEFRQLVVQFYPAALPIVVVGAGVAAFIWNVLRIDVKNY